MKKLNTFIIQIANTILNKCISFYLYNIRHITKAIICLNLRSVIMHNREITYTVKNRQFIKNSVNCKDQIFSLQSVRETYIIIKIKNVL